MEAAFCQVCTTQHGERDACPGDLRATGPERHGWAVAVDAPRGVDLYGVIVAPSDARWRARIVTYPHAPWTNPGSGCPLKFVGSTAEEAEARALEYILHWCAERKRSPRDGYGPWSRTGKPPGRRLPPRKRKSLAVRYGVHGITALSTTSNVSTGGMFVTAREPLPDETPLELEMTIFGCVAVMQGVVVWRRDELEPGRPRGMGIRLVDPPPVYKLFVHGLN